MDAPIASASNPIGTPAPAPAPAPAAPLVAATPMPSYPPPTGGDMGDKFAEGGETPKKSGVVKDFFSDINIMDVAIAALVTGAIFYTMRYYKYMMMLEKTGYEDLSTRVLKLESAQQAAKSASEANATGSNSNKKRPTIRL
jgi:hypothetical protein